MEFLHCNKTNLLVYNKMVSIIKKNGEKVYQCEECRLIYEDNKWADKCEKWCRKNRSCNLNIVKHSINKK